MTPNAQFDRVANLVVASQQFGKGRDLSALQFRFSVRQSDNETPNTLVVKIYNLNRHTENEILTQYDTIALQVGYKGSGPQGIFAGTIKMFRRGKESSTDRFLEISAADGDMGYNYGLVNGTLAAGSGQADVIKKAAAALQAQVQNDFVDSLKGGQLPSSTALKSAGGTFPRGKVLFGLARAQLGTSALTLGCRWSIQAGNVVFVPNTGYLPGEAVILNPSTGLIGTPESTPDGVVVKCLCNPRIQCGYSVQITSDDIIQLSTTQAQQQRLAGGINFPSYSSIIFPATVQDGLGTYRVIVAEHEGDTRGVEWYSNLVCLAIDGTSSTNSSVAAAG